MNGLNNIREIGKFQRTHALRGELNAILEVDDDFVAHYPLIIDVDGLPVPFFAENIRPKGSKSSIIKLDGVDSESEAKAFVNKVINARLRDLEEYYGEDFEDSSDIIGYRVVDSRLGDIGEIKRIDDSTENLIAEVLMSDGEEIVIPLADDLIEDIDDQSRMVRMDLPEGLIGGIDIEEDIEDDDED